MFRRHHVFATLTVALVTGIVTAGCSDDPQATPRVTFESDVTPGTNSPKDCPETNTWFTIGDFGNPGLGRVDPADPNSELIEPVRPVEDGASDQQGTVSISCSVTESGDGFEVRATAQLTGATGGSVTITGLLKATGDQSPVSLALTKNGRTYSASDCVVRYDTQVGHGIAAGRVWGSITCAKAEERTAQRTCQTHAQFRFENCAQ
jgi:hypothetical protein